MILGLTGAYCAGKNRVASLLAARGFEVLDVDKLGYRVIEEEKEAILSRFGESVLAPDRSVDRRALGKLVFGDKRGLADLEAIVHPAANRLTEEWVAARPGSDLVINAALLHRSTLFPRCDLVILVRAPTLTRLLRARRRDQLPLGVILERFRSQRDFETQYFGKRADIQIVINRGVFGLCAARRGSALERRLDSILARKRTDR